MSESVTILDLTHVDRAAALIVALGAESAKPILERLPADEITVLARAGAALPALPAEVLETVSADFETCLADPGDLVVDRGRIEALLTGALPPEQASAILAGLDGAGEGDGAFRAAANLPPEALAALLAGELPHTAAQIIARLDATVAARTLEAVNEAARAAILATLTGLRPLDDRAARALAIGLARAMRVAPEAGATVDGPALAAGILNNMSRSAADTAMASLSAALPMAAQAVKARLFTFDDLANLSARARATVLETVPTDRLVIALFGADPAVREAILSSLAARARRIVESELADCTEIAERDVEQAQRDIARIALGLAADGRIVLAPQETKP